jgi:putative SOS response-associated peptidase YedK
MCGRITATFEFSDIRVRWNLDRDLPLYTPRFNIAPEQVSPTIPVIVRHANANECRLMHWGLIPHWAADPSIGNRMINARAETLTELPSFRLLVDRRRCIIPADGFYEWRKEGKRKVPMWFISKARSLSPLRGCGTCGESQTARRWKASPSSRLNLMSWCVLFTTACP